MGNIIGQPLEGYVANQINSRQVLHGSGVRLDQNERTPDQINILNSNTAWIKLASGVFIDPSGSGEQKLKDLGFTETERSNLSGMGLAKKYVLYAGTSQYNNGTLSQREGFRPPTFESVYKDDELKGAIARDSEDSSYIYSRNLNSQGLHESDSGYAPMPGIISAEIKSLNRGSLEKAFIKIKAQNRQQLDIIDTLYMRLGYTVLLEWGNSLYTDDGINKKVVRNTIIEDKFFQHSGKRSYLDFLGLTQDDNVIEDYRSKYSGNYDGILAVISNFSWTFNPDGSYDIDLTLISLGDVIESLKTNLSVNSSFRSFISTNITNSPRVPVIENDKDLNSINTMLWLFTAFGESTSTVSIDLANNKGNRVVGNFLKRGKTTINNKTGTYKFYEKKSNDSGYTEIDTKTFTSLDPDESAQQYLIDRFHSYTQYSSIGESSDGTPISGYTREQINNKKVQLEYAFIVPSTFGGFPLKRYQIYYKRISISTNVSIDNPIGAAPNKVAFKLNTTTPNYYLRFDYLLQFLQENVIPEIVAEPENAPLFNIDYGTWNSFMYSIPNQISLDPRVCLVRNGHFKKNGGTEAKVLSELKYFRTIDNGTSTHYNAAYPLNIYLNFRFIINSLKSNQNDKGDVNIYGFISTLCTGLNKALGGINNLEPVIDKDTNTLKIIDSTPIPGITAQDNKNNYELMLYGYKGSDFNSDLNSFTTYKSNFIRNIDLKTTITSEYATMVTVGATADGYVKGTEATAFSVWNKGLVDRFKRGLIAPNQNTQQTATTGSNINEAETNYVTEFLGKVTQCYGFDGNIFQSTPVLGELNNDIIGKNISIVTEFYKYIIAKEGKKTQQAGTIGFIPFKLGITMDGISGIKIYNKLKVNSEFLPPRYGDTLNFIITGVNHRLQNNDWETTLDTIVIPKTSEIKALDIDFSAITTTNTTTGNKATGDLYIWVKGPNSTAPGFPNGYVANVLKFTVSGKPIAKPLNIFLPTFSGIVTNPTTGARVLVTNYSSVDASLTENENFFKDILKKIVAPTTQGNLTWMKAWRQIESGNALWNPLNTTQIAGGVSSNYNTYKVQNYFTRDNGINATVSTMTNGKYPNIIKALQKGIPSQVEGEKLARLLQERNPKQSDIDTLIGSW